MGDNRRPRPCTWLFIKAMEAQQQNNPRPRSMSRPPNPDQPSSSSRSQPSRAVSVPRFRAPTPQAVPKALPPSRGQSTAAKPKIAPLPRASGPSKKREAAPSSPEPTKKPRIKPAPIERPPQEVSELICVGLKGSGSSDAVDNSALEAMIKKRLARRATSNEAPSEPSVKRMAMKKPDLAEPQIVINPGPRGKKPPLTSATSSTTITSKPPELKPLAIPDAGPKPIDTPVFPELPKKELPTPKQSPKVSFWGSHGSYVHRKGSNASGQTSGSETDVVSEEKGVTGPSTLPMKMDFDKMEVDDGPDDELAQPLNPHQTPPNMNLNSVVVEIEGVKIGDIEIEKTGEANTDVPNSTDTPVLLKSPMKNAPNSASLASPTQDSGAMSIPGGTVANPPVIVEAVVVPKSDDRSVETAAEDFEQPEPYQSQTVEADLAEKSLVADVAGQIEFFESPPKPIRADINAASDTDPMFVDDFEYAPDGHNYGFEDARDAVLLFPKTDSLLNEPSADPSSEAMDVELIMQRPQTTPIEQLTDTDVVHDSGAAIEDVADEVNGPFEIDFVADPIEVEAVQDADNAVIAQDEAPYSDEYDADEKPVYEADNETNVQFEFGDVISEAEFHEYFDANVEPEHPDAIEVESDVFDNVSTVEADAELVFEDGFDADPETPAADTNINVEAVVPGDAVDVNADADFEEPCDADEVARAKNGVATIRQAVELIERTKTFVPWNSQHPWQILFDQSSKLFESLIPPEGLVDPGLAQMVRLETMNIRASIRSSLRRAIPSSRLRHRLILCFASSMIASCKRFPMSLLLRNKRSVFTVPTIFGLMS